LSRHRFNRGMFLLLVVGLVPMRGEARGKNSPTYDGAVDFGSQLIHLDDGCLTLDGRVTSGNFFDDLKRSEVGSRFEFRKRGKVVTEYPQLLTTSIRIAGDRCAAALSNSPTSVFRGDSYSLKFQVEWKDGMQLRPATLSPVSARCVGSTSIPIPSQDYTIPVITCQLTVDSKGVPLADHLIVSLFTADGQRLTLLSAAP
jgi:hypothetical protein